MAYIRENVAGILVNSEKHILLAQRSADKIFLPNVWHIPGGLIELGETAEQAIQREILEELSLEINTCERLKTEFNYTNNHPVGKAMTIFFLISASGSIQLNYENQAVAFIDVENIGIYLNDRSKEPTLSAISEALDLISDSNEDFQSSILLPN